MLVALNSFIGTAPRLDPRRLAPAAAQVAINVDFTDGTLNAIRNIKLDHTLGAPAASIYRDGTTWLGFTGIASVVRGPVAQDRLYYTGDGVPKMRVAGTVYSLALPAPVSAPAVTNLSAPGASPEQVLYVYTWVTGFGEESQPSPLSAAIDYTAGVIQRVNTFAATPAGRNITHRRIYRSQTTISGATELFFVTEIVVATTSYDYDATTTPLGEAITTKDFDPPPDTMSGLTQMPNGMMAAFNGKELYFSEPYQPHAWPEKYVLVVNSEIVGIAAFGSSAAILTREAPYVVQGITPDQMAMEIVEGGMPCTSGLGIVDVGFSALYPSTEGIMLIGEGRRENVTAAIFTREQWAALGPSSIIAARHNDQYVFLHSSSAFDLYDADSAGGWGGALEQDLEGDGATLGDPALYTTVDMGAALSAFGDQKVSWVDAFNSANTGLITSTVSPPIYLFSDLASNNLYLLDADGVSIYEWMVDGEAKVVAVWRSKIFTSNHPVAPGAFYVQTSRETAPGDTFVSRVYADGVLIREVTGPNFMHRLPADKLRREWEVEIESTIPVLAVYIAHTPDEILVALQ